MYVYTYVSTDVSIYMRMNIYIDIRKYKQYYLLTLLRPLTPFTEVRWSKFFSPTAYQKNKKLSQP